MKTLFNTLVLLIIATAIHAQTVTITGTVIDDTGIPLPGLNVIIKGTTNGTQTDFDGNYSIQASIGQTLTYSYVGYETQEIKIKDAKPINVTMASGAALEEVLIVGTTGRKGRKKYKISNESNSKTVRIRGVTSLSGAVPGLSIRTSRNNNSHTTETESYDRIEENIFKNVATAPLSTFSIDVDKAGYSNVRRMINNGQKIPKDAVKIEEMVNYFQYDYPSPRANEPFSINTEVAQSPWNSAARLVRIGLKGRDIPVDKVPNSNLVFLLDVSGSMGSPNKLPLLKSALGVLVDQLREQDKVSIVVYAGAAGLVLEPTSGANKNAIMDAVNRLGAGGSTAGGQGIELAYKIAQENFIENGNNRVILATDGDFNVGASSNRSMESLIKDKRKSGIFLTCLGFGMGNYRDSKMETLANKGNGNHAYIDSMQEAKKVLGTEFFGTIYTIAKDVKIQVEFNPAKVQAYRLIGYENRLLNDEDFKDDKKDAGELGSGHTVTALYEIIPVGVKSKFVKDVDKLKYSKISAVKNDMTDELLTVKFRYKKPSGNKSELITKVVKDKVLDIEKVSQDFQFATAVALFGMQLRDSKFVKKSKKEQVIALAENGRGTDKDGYRAEFIRLVKSSR